MFEYVILLYIPGLPEYPYEEFLYHLGDCPTSTTQKSTTETYITSKQAIGPEASKTKPYTEDALRISTISVENDTVESTTENFTLRRFNHFYTSIAPYATSCIQLCFCIEQTDAKQRNMTHTAGDYSTSLLIGRKMTSQYLMTKQCAGDDRASSRTIGYVGVLVMVAVAGWICLLDILKLLSFVRSKY